jgi:hypothetical protein
MQDGMTDPIPDGDGWDWFEKQQGETKSIVEQRLGMSQDDVAAHFQKCFSGPSGKVVLEYLEIFANDIRDFDPSLGFYNGAAFGFYRSGQKSFMSVIKAFMRVKFQPKKRAKGK